MRIAVTGADGFLGWHVRCVAFARGVECTPIGRAVLADPDLLATALSGVDAVVHCAGVNRGTDAEVTDGNLEAARRLADAVRLAPVPRVVYANSTHSLGDTGYGIAKRKAAELLAGAAELSDVVLPNLFGEHGRPHYNSFVATFCHEVAAGRPPSSVRDKEITLLHAQDAAGILVEEAGAAGHRVVVPPGSPVTVSTVLGLLTGFDAAYRCRGELPDIADRFRARLFNTYRSYLFPDRCPIRLGAHTDPRGTLVECVRTGAAGGQAYVSTTMPRAVRGEHVHLRKFERFVVVAGEAEIALRRLCTERVLRLRVSGREPVAVDIPTMWAHKLTNIGEYPVTAFFWSNEPYRAEDPDTFPLAVEGTSPAAEGTR